MRRLAAALVLVAGCKQVLDIPDNVTSVADGFHVGGTATGIAGASMPVLDYGNGKTFTLGQDGEFALPDLIADGGSYRVVAVMPAACDVQNGQGKVAGSAITNIVVTCDGFAALSSLGLSAPLDDLAATSSSVTIAGSLLTQQTSLTPRPLHAEASVSSLLRDGTTIASSQGTFGPLALTTATTLQLTVTNPTAPAPRTTRDYTVTLDPTHAPAQFAFRKPTTAEAGAHLGTTLAMDGTTLAIGEPDHSGGGQVRVLHRTGTTWVEDPPLHGDAGCTTFGAALAVLPTGTIVVGAPAEAAGGGGVYVFKNGTLDVHLTGAAGSQLGAAIATDGTRVIVGQPGAAGGGAIYTGTVNSTGSVALAPTSTSIVHHAGDRFGAAVAVAGGIFVVGAPGEASASTTDPNDTSYPGAGAAYAFGSPGSTVTYLKASNPGAGDAFGSSLAIDGDAQQQTILVGAPLEDSASTDPANNAADAAGAVYAFAGNFAALAQPAVTYLKSPHPAAGDGFGTSLALRGGVAVIGAPYENVNGTHDAGAAYVYRTSQLGSAPPAALTAATPGESDAFGAALALTLEALAVGAPHESSLQLDSGAVYGFR